MTEKRPWRPSETRPLAQDELILEQERLLSRLRRELQGMATRAAKVAAKPPQQPDDFADSWAILEPEREPRTMMIDGERGSGKTSLLLTLVQQGRDGQHGELERVRFAPVVDLQPLPRGMPLYAWLMQSLQPLAKRVDALATGCGRSGPNMESQLRQLQHAAIAGWDASDHKSSGTLEDWVYAHGQQLQNWWSLEHKWTAFLDKLFAAVDGREKSPPAGWILVVPVDDLDLYAGDGKQVLLALRRLRHRRLVYLLTGEHAQLELSVRQAIAKELNAPGDPPKEVANLATEMVRKAIPEHLHFRTRRTSLLELAKHKRDQGALGRVPAPPQALTGRADLPDAEAFNMTGLLAAYEAVARSSGELQVRTAFQLLDRLQGQIEDGEDWLMESFLAAWGQAVGVFDARALEQDPPRFQLKDDVEIRCAPRLAAGRQLGPLAPLGEPVPEGQAKRAFRLHLPVGFFPADWPGAALATVLLDAQATEARIELEGIDGNWEGTDEVHGPLRTRVYSPQGAPVAGAAWSTAFIRSPGQLVWLAQQMEAWSDIWSVDVGGTDAPAAVWAVLNTWLAVGAVDAELREVLDLAQLDDIGGKEPVVLLDGLSDWVRSHRTPAGRNAHAWLTEGLLGMVAPEVGLSLAVGAAVLRVVEAARGDKALTKADLDRQNVARRARLIVAADGGDGDALLTCIEGVDPWGVWAQLKERVAGNGWLLGLRLPKWGTGELLPSGWSHWQYAVVPGVGSGRTEARRLRDLFWRDDSHPDSPTPLGLGCFGLDTDPQANRKKVAALADRVARSSGELDTPGKVLDLLLGHHFPLTSVHGSGGVGPTEVHRTERHPVGSLSVVAISFGDGWDVRSDMSSASGAKVLAGVSQILCTAERLSG